MGRKRNYTDEDFVQAVKTSYSIAQTLQKLNLSASGANYKLAKWRMEHLGADHSHFTGQGHLKGKTHNWSWKNRIPLEEIMVRRSNYLSTCHLKKRLIRENILEEKCYECGLVEWRGMPIVVQLEHKNGDNRDNRKENLTFLCPNCHSQTKTFAGRNRKRKSIVVSLMTPIIAQMAEWQTR